MEGGAEERIGHLVCECRIMGNGVSDWVSTDMIESDKSDPLVLSFRTSVNRVYKREIFGILTSFCKRQCSLKCSKESIWLASLRSWFGFSACTVETGYTIRQMLLGRRVGTVEKFQNSGHIQGLKGTESSTDTRQSVRLYYCNIIATYCHKRRNHKKSDCCFVYKSRCRVTWGKWSNFFTRSEHTLHKRVGKWLPVVRDFFVPFVQQMFPGSTKIVCIIYIKTQNAWHDCSYILLFSPKHFKTAWRFSTERVQNARCFAVLKMIS